MWCGASSIADALTEQMQAGFWFAGFWQAFGRLLAVCRGLDRLRGARRVVLKPGAPAVAPPRNVNMPARGLTIFSETVPAALRLGH